MIFISYSRANESLVNRVELELEHHNLKAWRDKKDIEVGDLWNDKITAGINKSSVFMLFWSETAQSSPYVKSELARAQDRILEGTMQLIIIMLDSKLKFPDGYQPWQAEFLAEDADDVTITDLIMTLKDKWVKQIDKTSLGYLPHHRIEKSDYVSFPLSIGKVSTDRYCYAMLVGHSSKTFTTSVQKLIVALEFGGKDENGKFLRDILDDFQEDNIWVIHIKGPINDSGFFALDDHNQTEWEEARKYVISSITDLVAGDRPQLHFFVRGPVAFLGAICTAFRPDWWETHFYNYLRDDTVAKNYSEVIVIPREKS